MHQSTVPFEKLQLERTRRRATIALLATVLWFGSGIVFADRPEPVILDRPIPVLSVGVKFKSELRRPITASWRNISLRGMLRRISDERKVAIVLDRRIDPTQEIAVDLLELELLPAIEQIARRSGAGISVVGSTIYVGPPRSAAVLRTLVELRSNELSQSSSLPKGRQSELGNRFTLHWNDLDRPSDLLESVAKRFRLPIEDLTAVRHDLWAGATMPDVNAVEALSLILIQFELTFRWTDPADGVQLEEVPERVVLEKSYQPRGMTVEQALSLWKSNFAGLDAEAQANGVLVRATVEQHEAITESLRDHRTRAAPAKPEPPAPLARRTFTFRAENVPVRALMAELEKKAGLRFDYDPDALAAAKIDLDRLVDINVKEATADKTLHALFDDLKLEFVIDDFTIRLKPASVRSVGSHE